jgi:Recombinase zinc beta ribbon domain
MYVYAYGRRHYRRAADGKKTIQRKRECGDWLACIPNAHPGYISWEQFQENLKILENNGCPYELVRASPPREGAALLQGRAVCGRCGRHFRVRYAARRGRQEAWYVCDRGHSTRGEPNCQSIAGPPVDRAIGMLVTEEMTPAAVELLSKSGERSRLGTKRPISFDLRTFNRAAAWHCVGGARPVLHRPHRRVLHLAKACRLPPSRAPIKHAHPRLLRPPTTSFGFASVESCSIVRHQSKQDQY